MTVSDLKRLAIYAILGAAPVAALLAPAPAAATIMSATYTTTLSTGVDYTSYFSSPGVTNLAGQAVSIEFVYDTTLGLDTSTSTLRQRRGGTDYNAGLFILSTTVTIGGTSLGINSRNQQIWNVSPSSGPNTAGAFGFSTDDLVYQVGGMAGALSSRDTVGVLGSGLGISADLTKPGTYALTSVNANLYLTAFNPPYNWSDARYNVTANANGPGTLVVREVTSVAAVPEPAIWAMMLIGFGAIGSTMRARRRGEPSGRLKQIATC